MLHTLKNTYILFVILIFSEVFIAKESSLFIQHHFIAIFTLKIIHDQYYHHRETSEFIGNTDCHIVFYMMKTFAFDGLTRTSSQFALLRVSLLIQYYTKMKFSLRMSSVNVLQQETPGLITFAEETLNGRLHFLCGVKSMATPLNSKEFLLLVDSTLDIVNLANFQ